MPTRSAEYVALAKRAAHEYFEDPARATFGQIAVHTYEASFAPVAFRLVLTIENTASEDALVRALLESEMTFRFDKSVKMVVATLGDQTCESSNRDLATIGLLNSLLATGALSRAAQDAR